MCASPHDYFRISVNVIADPDTSKTQAAARENFRKPAPKDRLAARERPGKWAVMRQEWRNLLFLHWEAPADQLQALLPPGLKVDTHDGRAWIGIVPFFMKGVRPAFLPSVPGLSNFLELNVRTYVYDASGTPGVWFFSLDANHGVACSLGRRLFNLNYRNARIQAREGNWTDFRAHRKGSSEGATFCYRRTGSGQGAQPGSLDFFLTERYALYSSSEHGSQLWRGRVHHKPYQLHDAEIESYSSIPIIWNRQSPVCGPPQHQCASPGVEVEIFSLQRV